MNQGYLFNLQSFKVVIIVLTYMRQMPNDEVKRMQIKKVFNNNVSLVIDDEIGRAHV